MDSIIFDIDGTLWDARAEIADAWNNVIINHTNYDVRITPELFTPLFGKPANEIIDIIFPGLEETEKRELDRLLIEYPNEYLRTHPGTLYDGIKETIITLSEKFPLFIASNCGAGYAEVFLETTGLAPFFKAHICYGDTGMPKGENIGYLIEKYGLKSPVYVGDMQGDADASRVAGIPIIYVEYGLGTIDNPDYTVTQPRELIGLLNSLEI